MPMGTVTRVFETKGFGYITPDEGDRDLLVQVDAERHQQCAGVGPAQLPPNGYRSDNHGPRVAFSEKGVLRTLPKLCQGTRVQYEIEDSDAGLHAVAVAPLH